MKIFMATVDVRHARWWIPGVLSEVTVKASSEAMATKRAVAMAKQALPRHTQIKALSVKLVYLGTSKTLPLIKDLVKDLGEPPA